MDKKIIDVSRYNGTINWSKVDCDGVIIRIAYRGYGSGKIVLDDKFIANIKGAIANGIPVGVYFMSQAINATEAIEEAVYTVNTIKGYNVELPIFIDSEPSGASNNSGRADGLSKSARTTICKAFCDKIVSLGYKAGTYASTSWFKSNLDVSQLLNYYVWVAQYASTCKATHRVDMWQYTSKGSINGISGNVDISHGYVDFEENINTEEPIEINNDTIKIVQTWLKNYDSTIIIDGIAGSNTLKACHKALQTELNNLGASLKVDGVIGSASKTALSKYGLLKLGSSGNLVKVLESYLYIKNYNPQEYKGKYNEDVAMVVEQYQSDNGLSSDRICGINTWSKIVA